MATTKSIEQLENDYWKATGLPTGLVERCHRFRKIPIGDLTPEQLRTLIGQQIGLKHLVPLALSILSQDILTEGDYYKGDVLASVLNVDISFWEKNPALKVQVQHLILDNRQIIEQSNNANQFRQLLQKMDAFASN
jgi:hypothetical protein